MGFRVIPCKPGGKEPVIANWNKLATQDVDKIQDWWEKWPDANPGIVTEGLLVVDCDTPAGSDLMAAEITAG